MTTFKGDWSLSVSDDEELYVIMAVNCLLLLELASVFGRRYDYARDPWETTNFAAVANYSHVVAELRAVLRQQYAPS